MQTGGCGVLLVVDAGDSLPEDTREDVLLVVAGVDEAAQQHMLDHVYRGAHWLQFDRGVLSYDEAAAMLEREHGRPKEEYLRALRGWMELKEPLEEGWRAARLCKEKGKRIVLLSNYPKEGYEFLRKKFASRFDLFDDACISCYIHQIKPEEPIYRTLMADCGVQAGRAVFIDDLLANVEGAMNVGIHGFHMHETGMMDRFFR